MPSVRRAPPAVRASAAKPAAAEVTRLRETLGVDATQPTGPFGVGRSRILDLLGEGRVAPLQAEHVPGRVAWFNFDLARQLGLKVEGDVVTPELEKQLVDALSLKAVATGETADGPTETLYADMYGGSGLGGHDGAARSAFLDWGNLSIKGVGRTPLARDEANFMHSDGRATLWEAMFESMWGELHHQQMSHGSTRILAIIDQADVRVYPDGGEQRRALVVRAGPQARPGHLIEGWYDGGEFSVPIFIEAARDRGVLRLQPNGEPDFTATITAMLDAQAQTAAELYRHQLLHGAISTSNLDLGGGMIDLATNSATVRTAPVYTLDHLEEAAYGVEYKARAEELGWAYHAMYNALPQGERSRLNLTVIEPLALIEKSYRRALAVQLAEAAGLKSSLVARLAEKHPEVLERFAQRVRRLAELTDPDAQLSVKKEVLESASTVDVFAFLRGYAAAYFDPSADRHAAAVALLDKRGPVDGRKVTALEQAYAELMQAAADSWPGHYPSREAMEAAVVRRAAFENQPNDALFRKRLDTFFSDTIARYQHIVGTTGLTDLSAEQRRQVDALFASGIDKAASAGVRSFEGLLSHGGVKKLAGGALELNARTIDALGYALVARPDGHRAVRVELPLDAYRITRSQVSKSALRYRYTTDGWKTSSEVGATLAQTERGPVARFDIDVSAEHGGAAQLEGQLRWKQGGSLQLVDGSTDFRGYTYAVPDPVDFERLAEGIR